MVPVPEPTSARLGTAASPAVALFGGAFNPPHRAHERIVRAALAQLPIDRVVVLPAGRHPWKEHDPDLAPAAERLELARLAFGFDPRIVVDDHEQRSATPCYTIDTLRHFRRVLGPGTTLYWIVGSDNLVGFPRWREARAILALAEIAVYPRTGHPCDPAALAGSGLSSAEIARLFAHPLHVTQEATSSTAIRAALAAGHDVAELLAPAVHARILAAHLYGT